MLWLNLAALQHSMGQLAPIQKVIINNIFILALLRGGQNMKCYQKQWKIVFLKQKIRNWTLHTAESTVHLKDYQKSLIKIQTYYVTMAQFRTKLFVSRKVYALKWRPIDRTLHYCTLKRYCILFNIIASIKPQYNYQLKLFSLLQQAFVLKLG